MKKPHITTTAILLTAALLLSGCSKQNDTSLPDSDSGISSYDPTSSDTKSDVSSYIESFPLDSFTAPDGSTVNKSEAVYAAPLDDGSTYAIGFDFSYMRYAKPLFDNTFENPGLIDWDTLEFDTDIGFMIEDTDYFKVKAGDTLENGLTVESAQYWISRNGELFSSDIVLDGELTLKGVLHCIAEVPDYIDNQGDLLFFADTTENDFVPMPVSPVDLTLKWTDTTDGFAAVFDGIIMRFGNIKDTSIDLTDTFRNGSYVEAEITMKNIRVMYRENGGGFVNAELLSADPV